MILISTTYPVSGLNEPLDAVSVFETPSTLVTAYHIFASESPSFLGPPAQPKKPGEAPTSPVLGSAQGSVTHP